MKTTLNTITRRLLLLALLLAAALPVGAYDFMIDGIYYHSIDDFKRRLSKISNSFEDIPSTNFLLFLERFESDDTSWIDDVNSLRKK